ncbi:hypothetical protein BU251_03345 [Candidatus Velamenicoccus archaeovorus]|uniref:Uncharacterized protein n=2 Tax=Velamenicoccus archaeovorus TaxID=1930593 RepID=A0A410P3Q9_VELA1|nr:hypothetical protein BU251_03345 [Candidatus Velamenicoccus archaeovorus]
MSVSMKKRSLFLISIVLVSFITPGNSFSENKKNENDDPFWQWFVWKYENVSEPRQKEVINYFKTINKISKESEKTRYVAKNSFWGDPDINKAISITKDSLEKAREIVPPQECKRHYDLTIEILKELNVYQKNRSKFKDPKIFEQETKGVISQELLNEEARQREYFIILRNVGFYDHFFDEVVKLKLMTRQEAKKMHNEIEEKTTRHFI